MVEAAFGVRPQGAASAQAFQFHAMRCDRIVTRVFEQIAAAPLSLPADHRL
jgi:hypothetical protein